MAKRPLGTGPWRTALAIALCLPLLAGCWWLESEPGPGEWRHRSGTIGDFREHNTASLYEQDGFGQLLMECGSAPVIMAHFASGRDDAVIDRTDQVPLRYRLDRNPPVAMTAETNVMYLWPPHGQRTGEDPLVRQIAAARQLTVRVDWSATDRQILRFDLTNAAAAVARLREMCTS